MSDFGDSEPDDVYADDGEPDPLQVAIRLHEIRSALLVLAGYEPLPPWHVYGRAGVEVDAAEEYTPALVALAVRVDAARRVHDARRYVADRDLPPWDHLPPDARDVAVFIVGAVIDWLVREGTRS